MKHLIEDLMAGFQFLTRLPLAPREFHPDSLARAVKLFPLVGFAVGAFASLLHVLLLPHLSRPLSAFVVLAFLVIITNGIHEDGLADTADGIGGGWSREQMLNIMRDSRIGSFGALAITLSLIGRFLLLFSLPVPRFTPYVISAHVLCRWTTLPLSFFLPAARAQQGQGAQIARNISTGALVAGTLIGFGIVAVLLRARCWVPISAAFLMTVLSGLYFWRRLGGMTGDCFGTVNQLTEIVVYFCGVWI